MRKFLDLPLPAGHMLPFRPEFTEEKPLEICFSHVSFSYPESEKKILDDVSFTLHAGEHTALVGINGAGKSTIVKLICGLYQPTEGQITVNGLSLTDLNPAQYYESIAGGLSGTICSLVLHCRERELFHTGRDGPHPLPRSTHPAPASGRKLRSAAERGNVSRQGYD